MDSVVTQQLTRLSMFLTQELDFQVNAQRFRDEAEYAVQVLGLVDEIGNYEFSAIAAHLRKEQARFHQKNVSESATDTTV